MVLNSFKEDEFKFNQIEIKLGNYHSVYKEVLVNHRKQSVELLPVMCQAVDLYLEMLKDDNDVIKFISKNKDLSTQELLIKLFHLFPTIGYGDFQYIELINKKKAHLKYRYSFLLIFVPVILIFSTNDMSSLMVSPEKSKRMPAVSYTFY